MSPIQVLLESIESKQLWDQHLTIKRNEFLKQKGSIDTNLYFITSGSLRIYVINGEEEHTIRFGYKDSFIASLDSFITEKPSDFYIQALKKTNIKSISKKAFMLLINTSKHLFSIWITILQDLILQQIEREKDLLTTSPIDRYQRVIKRSPILFQEIPHKYIADYLRMTPETLSRIKKS